MRGVKDFLIFRSGFFQQFLALGDLSYSVTTLMDEALSKIWVFTTLFLQRKVQTHLFTLFKPKSIQINRKILQNPIKFDFSGQLVYTFHTSHNYGRVIV